MDDLSYISGFGNEFASEAKAGALPEGQNSPQSAPYGLYAEQISGSAFTAPKAQNKRSWFYRLKPSVCHGKYRQYKAAAHFLSAPFDKGALSPNQLRWSPKPALKDHVDFIDGIHTVAGNGVIDEWSGLAVHVYKANVSMGKKHRYFYNGDGEMLIVPQGGEMIVRTEMGVLALAPEEIAVIPRGIKFAVDLADGISEISGYICENYGAPFELPERGPIGANGLANPRDFLYPVAAYEEFEGGCTQIAKFMGNLWEADLRSTPLNVVAWHGNYAPYKYNLKHFNTINTVSFDHPDPSIFTVLTSPSHITGTANVDFVIFPPRWMVAEKTFRPPYFHRNLMSEFMGMINGQYDGKSDGFAPGGYSLHNTMSAHGPDSEVYKKAINAELQPHYLDGGLAFMFESRYVMRPTHQALEDDTLQPDYIDVWQDMA
ncbi:MAG: homogentisate 1,2-dioxygenase [Pseudomonadota bacterium]|nr:homogentisate 1,2-dioxygenase [Pseudomonadota bacterium]MED5424034.1 homogentisate 1,2-dioxygenase [Pseudomonadota bacterium]